MLDFDDNKVVEFKYGGEVYSLEYPSFSVSKKYKKLFEAKNGDELELLVDYLCECGGKKEVLEKLRLPQLNALAMELASESMEAKKN